MGQEHGWVYCSKSGFSFAISKLDICLSSNVKGIVIFFKSFLA